MASVPLSSLDLSLEYGSDLELSLLKLWRVTNNGFVYSKYSSTERLNNRSWRLLNKKALLDAKQKRETALYAHTLESMISDLSKENLIDSEPKMSQFLSNRVEPDSHSTLFSHSSRLSLNSKSNPSIEDDSSSDDISDISEEDDYISSSDEHDMDDNSNPPNEDEDSYFPRRLDEANISKTRTTFVKGFSPSSPSKSNRNESSEVHPISKTTTNQSGKSIFYIENSPSPPQNVPLDGNSDEVNHCVEYPNSEITDKIVPPSHIKRQDSLFSNFQLHSSITEKEQSDCSSTDISEDELEEDLSEDGEDKPKDSFPDRIKSIENGKGRKKSTDGGSDCKRSVESGRAPDDDSEWLSVSSEEEESRSTVFHPLKFDKRSYLMTTEPRDIERAPLDKSAQDSLVRPRSLLSSMFLNQMHGNTENHQTPHPHVSKPILKRSSTTGIVTIDQSRKNGSNHQKWPSILFSKKYASLTDLSKNYPHYQNMLVKTNILNDCVSDQDEDDSLLGKQKSIVGISDFNVTTKSLNSGSSRTEVHKSGSIASHENRDTLSSSLNKYSSSVSNHSFKNLLSKSSLNLANLFSNNNKVKSARLLDIHGRCPQGSQEEVPNDIHLKSSEDLDSSTNLSTRRSEKSPKLSSSSSSSTGTASAPIATETHSKPLKLSPKSTRRNMLATELSKSLKESIIIDYKLGKIPLPTRVVHRRTTGDSQPEEIDEVDDYHSKGW
ncbi:uncharacterized protein PRCAT00003206001 [Priceomyces carsonii]|uniref:uncharacterized protein n=1 Tax=Priceomyces carsonii TaxID=28549 RepID=UPI002ED9171B|nr:unnamed protein product [Priceomyces carsonii]